MSDYERLLGVVRGWLADVRAKGGTNLAQDLESRIEELGPTKAERPRVEARAYLEWYNREFRRRFTLALPLIKLVKALTAQGYEQKQMRLVSLYLKSRWEGDVKMQDYLVPSTMLTMAKFAERLDLANEWWGEGR